MFGRRKDQPEPSGQQRRAKANREADRAGHAAIDRRTAPSWGHTETPKKWWKHS
jgi:hypothetical protein